MGLRKLFGLVLLAAGALAAFACSSGSDGNSGASCNKADECTTWQCTCKNGSTPSIAECANHVCADSSVCSGMCKNAGGVVSATEQPSIKDSPECDAYCAKVASLGCGVSCDRLLDCAVNSGECPDQKRAFLQCEVDTGTWQCNQAGGWSLSSGCPLATCPADAGTD